MGLLEGKKALIFGVANDHSIAWGIARALHAEGAAVGFSSVESLIQKRVRPLAERLGSTFVEPCDVQSDEQIRTVFERWQAAYGDLDILVHALAFARREDLDGAFVDTSRDGFALAIDVSAYSLLALVREARPILHPGSSVLTLTYYGAEKVVARLQVDVRRLRGRGAIARQHHHRRCRTIRRLPRLRPRIGGDRGDPLRGRRVQRAGRADGHMKRLRSLFGGRDDARVDSATPDGAAEPPEDEAARELRLQREFYSGLPDVAKHELQFQDYAPEAPSQLNRTGRWVIAEPTDALPRAPDRARLPERPG